MVGNVAAVCRLLSYSIVGGCLVVRATAFLPQHDPPQKDRIVPDRNFSTNCCKYGGDYLSARILAPRQIPKQSKFPTSLLLVGSQKSEGARNDFADESSFLSKSAQFFVRMVDPMNNRFFYECFPPSGERRHLYMPMRDLAAAWDATKILLWNDADHGGGDSRVVLLNQNQKDILRQAVQTTIEAYLPVVAANDDGGTRIAYKGSNHGLCSKLESNIVQDPSHIGDSAMMLLVLVNSQKLGMHLDSVDASRLVKGLVHGILSQQDDTSGAYRISFVVDGDIYQGIEFFPGEAMLALLEVCQFFLQGHNGGINNSSELCGVILESVQRAYIFYSGYYHQRHENDAGLNFNIWQIQAHCALCRVLVEIGRLDQACLISKDMILPMARDVIDSPAWTHSLARGKSFYGNLKTIEIACGLDAIVDVLEVHDYILGKQEERYGDASSLAVSVEELQMCICNAVEFLNWSQEQVPEDSIGYGGLGFGGMYVPEQRLDVTGHAVSAMYKLILKSRAKQED